MAAAGLGHRITVITGDAMAGELPAGYDVFLLANLVHHWSAEQNQELFQRVREADSVDEARDWLDHTGWRFTAHNPLAGPQSLIVARAA